MPLGRAPRSGSGLAPFRGMVPSPFPSHVPVLPIRNTVLFPGISMPLVVGRPCGLLALEAAVKAPDGLIPIVSQKTVTPGELAHEMVELYPEQRESSRSSSKTESSTHRFQSCMSPALHINFIETLEDLLAAVFPKEKAACIGFKPRRSIWVRQP